MTEKKYFKIFTGCIVAKGVTKSIISDIQRQNSEFIPNSLAEIIERLNKKENISDILNEYDDNDKETFQEYLEFLVQEDYGFYCDDNEFDRFPNMDFSFQSPSHISNAVIELKKVDIYFLENIISQIEKLGVKDIVLVFYEKLENESFYEIKKYFEATILKSVEIISEYQKEDLEFLQKISFDFERLTSLVFYDSPFEKQIDWNNKILCDVSFIKKNYSNFIFCGAVDLKYFNTNLPKVLEAVNHNSCLYKKIGIDVNGNIKNCPAMPQSFGNIKDTTLEEALNHKDFKKYWNLTKDQIEVCKDCEFRYICTDCRAYTERTHKNKQGLDTSKPLKCGYNPYTGEWEEWSKNPLKEKAINFYGMQELLKKS